MNKLAQFMNRIMPLLAYDVITDREARALFEMWKNAEPDSRRLSESGADASMLRALKAKGYVSGFGEAIELTEKGRTILVEMVTNEPSSFLRNSSIPPYSSIKARASQRRPRQTHTKKASRDSFNLRRESMRRLRGE